MPQTKLSRDNVERQIHEMWSAIDGLGDVEPSDRDLAVEQAHKTERDLRARLEKQEQLERYAPLMLEALKKASWALNLWKCGYSFPEADLNGARERVKQTLTILDEYRPAVDCYGKIDWDRDKSIFEEERPFWLWFAALQFCAEHECEESASEPCTETDKCITEYCPPCAAQTFLAKMPNNPWRQGQVENG